VVVYHTYNIAKSIGSGPILEAEGSIPANFFTAGTMSVGTFLAPAKLVQAATSHTVAFTLTNALPVTSSNAEYSSRIIILMPEVMYVASPTDVDVISLDNALQGLTFQRDETFSTGAGGACSANGRVCYAISYTNKMDIPKGTAIKLSITGTNNQDSVRLAGNFQVITQLYEIADPSQVYAIDEGAWATDFTTTPGAVTSTTGKVMAASTWVTHADKAAYTIHFTTYQYIPKNGVLTLAMPAGVEITSSPVADLAPPAGLGYASHSAGKNSNLKLKASAQVPAGSYELKWGGVKNPRSTAPTGIFNITIADGLGHPVATGSIDTIQMRTPGSFRDFTVTPKALVVGATTDYEVKLTAAIPIHDKDQLVIDFPAAIGTPGGEENFCEPPPPGQSTCVATVACSSARGSITVQIGTTCSSTGDVFAFTIKGVRNAHSMVAAEIKTASIKSFA
jgi:hypothetical protein